MRGDERHRERDVQPIRHPVGQRAGQLPDRGIDGVARRDDVGAAAAELEVVVREDRRHAAQIDALELVEREELVVVAEREACPGRWSRRDP